MKRIAALILASLLAGCAYTYPVTDAGEGVYYAESPPDYTWVGTGAWYYDPFMYRYWYSSLYHPYDPWYYDRLRHPHPVQVPYRAPSVVGPERPALSVPLVYRDHPTMMRDDLRVLYGTQAYGGKAQTASPVAGKSHGFGAMAKPAPRASYAPKTYRSSTAGPARAMNAPQPRSAGHRPAMRSSRPSRSRPDD